MIAVDVDAKDPEGPPHDVADAGTGAAAATAPLVPAPAVAASISDALPSPCASCGTDGVATLNCQVCAAAICVNCNLGSTCPMEHPSCSKECEAVHIKECNHIHKSSK
jgi:hypothetical protein